MLRMDGRDPRKCPQSRLVMSFDWARVAASHCIRQKHSLKLAWIPLYSGMTITAG